MKTEEKCRLKPVKFVKREIVKGECWLFECECGRSIIAYTIDVDSGKVKDCGCVSRKLYTKTAKYIGREKHLKRMFHMQNEAAKKKYLAYLKRKEEREHK